MSDININMLANLEPEQIVKWYESKGYKFSWNWKDTWQEAQAKSFTVSKAMKLDILQSIHQEVNKIFTSGNTFDEFKKEPEQTLKRLGWWGKVPAKDVPGWNGEGDPNKMIQLGSPRRLKTIYFTNANVGYNSGRWKHQFENKKNRPYLRYNQIQRGSKRDDHAKYHHKVFRVDDPIWDIIYPPNGFYCGCYANALSEAELNKSGLKVEDGKKYNGDSVAEGWNYNPGKAAFYDYEKAIKATPIDKQKTWKDFNRLDIRNVDKSEFIKSPSKIKEARTVDEALQIFANEIGVSESKPTRIIETPMDKVVINYHYLTHIVEKRSDARERFSKYLVPALEKPYEIYLTKYDDGIRFRYISLFSEKDNLFSVVKINKDGSLLWNVINANDARLNKLRVGELIYKK